MKLKRFFFLFIFCSIFFYAGHSQKVILKVTDAYFRYNPFKRDFRNFLTHLVNDTLLADKEIIKRTDSTLFFFKGTYKKYNTFGLNPTRVEIRLAESEIDAIDKKQAKDTILLYQLLVYTSRKNKGTSDIKKEFDRFDRKYKTSFYKEDSRDLKEKNKPAGVIRNYYLGPVGSIPVAPVSTAYTNSEDDENVFSIILRIKVKENIAFILQSDSLDIFLDFQPPIIFDYPDKEPE